MSMIAGRDLRDDVERSCDVCIVGSGAGGGIVAAELARAGLDVVMLEEGGHNPSKDFDLVERNMIPRMYQDRGTRTTSDGAIIVLQGRTFGGGTTVNWTTCFRTPPTTLAYWGERFGLDMLTPDSLAPHFDHVEERLGITTWPEVLANPNNRTLLDGGRKLGWKVEPLKRNVRGCRNSGYCGVGCAWDAKQSMLVTTLPEAVESGMIVYTDVRAEQIEMDGQRCRAVHGVALQGTRDRPTGVAVTIRPRILVVAGGAINSPMLLLKSGINPGGLVGTRTFLHPTIALPAIHEQQIAGWSGAPQSVGSHEFADRGDKMGFFLECPPLQPMLASTAHNGFGLSQAEFMRQLPHLSAVIALMIDGIGDDPGATVTLRRDGRPAVTYQSSPRFEEGLKAATIALARAQLAAGAKKAMTLHNDPIVLTTEADLARLEAAPYGLLEHQMFTAHQMGGCTMGTDPRTSVVDPEHRLRGADNVFVIDGSVLPSGLGVNPSETIYALAHRASAFVIDTA